MAANVCECLSSAADPPIRQSRAALRMRPYAALNPPSTLVLLPIGSFGAMTIESPQERGVMKHWSAYRAENLTAIALSVAIVGEAAHPMRAPWSETTKAIWTRDSGLFVSIAVRSQLT